MSDEARIDRCECINKRFAQLEQYGSFDEAQRRTGVGLECGGCEPYVKLMFATGETSFAVDDPRVQAFESP